MDENNISELFKLLDVDNCGEFRYDQATIYKYYKKN